MVKTPSHYEQLAEVVRAGAMPDTCYNNPIVKEHMAVGKFVGAYGIYSDAVQYLRNDSALGFWVFNAIKTNTFNLCAAQAAAMQVRLPRMVQHPACSRVHSLEWQCDG